MKIQEITPAELYFLADKYAAGKLGGIASRAGVSTDYLVYLLKSKLPPGRFREIAEKQEEAISRAKLKRLRRKFDEELEKQVKLKPRAS